MVAVGMTLAYVALPLIFLAITRSTKWTVLTFVLIFALAGSLVQASVGLGVSWTLARLQVLIVVLLALAVAAAALWVRRTSPSKTPMNRQIWVLWIPALVIGLIFLTLRLMASPDPGPLANIGFLVSQSVAEDNAKWLNLSSLLVAGEPLSFAGGYAGGPYLLFLTVAITFTAATSQVLLGGINEVATASGGVIATSFLIAALTPFAFAPLVEARWKSDASKTRYRIPPAIVIASMVPLLAASLAVSGFGHQSLQLVMFFAVIWLTTFFGNPTRPNERLVATIAVVSVGVIWFPLNVWAVAVLVVCAAWMVRALVRDIRRGRTPSWTPLLLLLVAVIAYWDGLVSSLVYALGLDGSSPATSALGSHSSTGIVASVPVPSSTASLFSSPGGTEQLTATLAILTAISVLGAAFRVRQLSASQRKASVAIAPIASLVLYALAIALADAVLTGQGDNYATTKMIFFVGMVVLASTLPLALTNLDPWAARTTVLPWVGIGAVLFTLIADGLLPRAISTVSPTQWAASPSEGVPYWTTFEVRPTPEQNIETLPIGCVYLPPGAEKPTGNIDGQLTYTCTRLLIGLNGAEGRVGSIMDWIGTDWLANGSYWDDWYGNLEAAPENIKSKRFILLDERGNVIGFETLQALLDRYPPEANGVD